MLSMTRQWGAIVVVLAALSGAGCGDDGGTEDTDSGTPPADSGGGVDGGGGDVDGGGGDVDGGGGDVDGGGGDVDGGEAPDSGTPTADGGGGAVGVMCGTMTCPETEECCVTGGPSYECVPIDSCTGGTLGCDGPEDCSGGDVCCGMAGPGGGSPSTACVADSECAIGRLCRTADDCDAGDMCCPYMGAAICWGFGACPGVP